MEENKTKYQETFHFSDANLNERRSIYKDIGFSGINILQGKNAKSVELIRDGINASGQFEGKSHKIKEIISHTNYSNNLVKQIPIELYSDFEENTQGWLANSRADEVFYFFNDAVISANLSQMRYFVDKLYYEESLATKLQEMVNTFIQNGVKGKTTSEKNGIGIYITKNENGHHAVGITANTDILPDYAMDVTEYYFEEEEPEEPQEEPDVENENNE